MEYAGTVWLNSAPTFPNAVFAGTMRLGALMVFVSAGFAAVSDTRVAVFETLLAPVTLMSTGCGTEDAFTSFKYKSPFAGSLVTQ